jgi:hypothetical protein
LPSGIEFCDKDILIVWKAGGFGRLKRVSSPLENQIGQLGLRIRAEHWFIDTLGLEVIELDFALIRDPTRDCDDSSARPLPQVWIDEGGEQKRAEVIGADDKHERVWSRIEDERGLFEHGFIVGEFRPPDGQRLSRQLVCDVESFLIHQIKSLTSCGGTGYWLRQSVVPLRPGLESREGVAAASDMADPLSCPAA